jgi:hypothetical protein
VLTTVISVVNNTDGTYTVTFSEPITNLNPGTPTPDPNLILYSPGINLWIYAATDAAAIGNAIVLTAQVGRTDCTLFAVMAAPANIAATDSFEIVSPQLTF